jgi:Cu+-exporting ATPase
MEVSLLAFLGEAGVLKIPHPGGSMTNDPVCGMRVDEESAEFQTQFAGKKYYFCSADCREEFEDQPADYVETAAA